MGANSAATGVRTNGVGSRVNTAHLNLLKSIVIETRDRTTRKPVANPGAHSRVLKKAAILRELAGMGLSIPQAAKACGIDYQGVYWYATHHGINFPRAYTAQAYDTKRGFIVPGNRRAEYMDLRRRVGLSVEEAGMCMGLLKRPSD